MIYALQHRNPPRLFPIEFCKMLEQLLRRIILGGYFWKENKEEEGRALIVAVSGFHFFQGSYFLSHERMFFLHKFSHGGAFQFQLCYAFLYT